MCSCLWYNGEDNDSLDDQHGRLYKTIFRDWSSYHSDDISMQYIPADGSGHSKKRKLF